MSFRSMLNRRRSVPFAWLASMVLTALVSTAAWADDGFIENVGGTARLMTEHAHIRMQSETVRARVSTRRIEVDCTFVMHNQGPADTVLIGFPDQSGTDFAPPPMRAFRSWVDGVEVRCDTMSDADHGADGEEWTYWWTKRVGFAPGATRTIRDHYVSEPGGTFLLDQTFAYILRTGASWAGTIGAADVTVSLVGIDPAWITYVRPKPVVRGRVLSWSWRDFEPGASDGFPGEINVTWYTPEARARYRNLVEGRRPPDPAPR